MGNPAKNCSESLTGSAIAQRPITPAAQRTPRQHTSVIPIVAAAIAARKIGVAIQNEIPYAATIDAAASGTRLDRAGWAAAGFRHVNQAAVMSAAKPHAASASPAIRFAHHIHTGQNAIVSSIRTVARFIRAPPCHTAGATGR
jgi:hypothetical protein